MKPLLVSSGEPAGIGPDLCLALANSNFPLVVLGDKALLIQRAKELNAQVLFSDYTLAHKVLPKPNHLYVLSLPCAAPVISGTLNSKNATYVLKMLTLATDKCLNGEFSALVTAPVHKEIINQAGFNFTGHTEFLSERCKTNTVVMMLACDVMKVALVTTHLPLKQVSGALSIDLIVRVIEQLHIAVSELFGMDNPIIKVAGLNPHAGEGGYLGREEIEIITPALNILSRKGIKVLGPFSADTLFTPSSIGPNDVFVTMYHDQGLPVLKYAGFGSAVNVTLGLPIIRTSVDHGTALELAGKGLASETSLLAAVKMAFSMAAIKSRAYVKD